VQRPRPATLPLPGELNGIGVVLRGPLEVSLYEAHAPAAAQVYGREHREAAQEPRAHFKKFS
jgi:hypothetical protein